MKSWKRRFIAMLLTVAMAFTLLPTGAMALTGTITINVRVYDENTGNVYNVGTDTVDTGDPSLIQSAGYRIPSLSTFTNNNYGRVTKVVGNWYFPAHDSSEGANVEWSTNVRNVTMTYWVTQWKAPSNSGSGSNSSANESQGGGTKTTWTQTIVYHSNYPNGADNTVSVTYNCGSYTSAASVTGNLKDYASCGFSVPDGYKLADRYWNTKADGTGTDYGTSVYTYKKSDGTVHLYAQYVPSGEPTPVSRATLTYMDGTEQYAQQQYFKNDTVIVTNNTNTKVGYTFKGWDTSASASQVVYQPSDTFVITQDTTLYAVWEQDEVPEPEKPSDKEVEELLNSAVTIDCVNENVEHANKTYALTAGSYTIGDIASESGNYTCTVTITAAKYVENYNSNSDINTSHTLADGESGSKTIELKYSADEKKWTPNGATSVTFKVKCDAQPETSTDWNKLTISKSADKTEAKLGETVTYTITVKNETGKDLTDITVSEKLDKNLALVSATTDGQYANDVWTIPSLENGEKAVLTIEATVKEEAETDTISNTVTITDASDGEDKLPDNEDKPSDSVDITVTPSTSTDETDWDKLTINKSADKTEAKPGDTVTYTITVTNNTGKDLTDITVSEKLNENLIFVSTDRDGDYDEVFGEWSIGTLANGASATLTIKATVSKDAAEDDIITNEAVITGAKDEDGTELPSDNEKHSSSADITVTSTPDDPTPGPGNDDGSGSSGGSGDDASWVLPALAVGAAAVAVPIIIHHFKNQTPAVPAEGVEEVPPVVVEEEIPVISDEVVEAQPVPKTGDATHPIALALGGAALLALGGALGRKRREDDEDSEQ